MSIMISRRKLRLNVHGCNTVHPTGYNVADPEGILLGTSATWGRLIGMRPRLEHRSLGGHGGALVCIAAGGGGASITEVCPRSMFQEQCIRILLGKLQHCGLGGLGGAVVRVCRRQQRRDALEVAPPAGG